MNIEKNKKCVLILPYFGKFNNYFPLFLKSCGANPEYDWLIFTDDRSSYNYPLNVHVIYTTLQHIKALAKQKFGFEVCLQEPHKLCDYKPSYGYLFEEYLTPYAYWGHCDCDLIFGNLEEILTPLLKQGYDKLFAAGHLTLYKNTKENNRRFMHIYKNRYLYKEAFTQDGIYVFDEDYRLMHAPDSYNVHSIFLNEGAKIYATDLAMNASITSAKLKRDYYDPQMRSFVKENYQPSRYFWNNGNLISAAWDRYQKKMVYTSYSYMHLQLRTMRMDAKLVDKTCFEILPDRFVERNKIPQGWQDMHVFTIRWPYWYWIDRYKKKIRQNLYKLNHQHRKEG
ncbi:MAG: hypothetical protein E7189_07610 [Erysipelotrichaceae bacterium]|nr:hypothetical protein [Erysipelotrichaceae bacterium]